jgi:hypothetical protein
VLPSLPSLPSLSSTAGRDPAVAGEKAARLARAAAAGLPVLPGWVVPASSSAAAILAGADALAARGRSRAVLTASSWPAPEVAPPGGSRSWVVRSSTPLDGDPRWAGAFASYLDVDDAILGAAVRGCWASVFAADPLGRAAALGVSPGAVRVAALIQPFVRLAAGGIACREPDGTVTVTGVSGSPAGLLAGRRPAADLDPRVVAPASALAQASAGATGDTRVEWGWDGSTTWLLQSSPAPAVEAASVVPAFAGEAPRLLALARTVASFRGSLADELVVPWALGADREVVAEPLSVANPLLALDEARRMAASLTSDVWRLPLDAAIAAADEAARRLLAGDVVELPHSPGTRGRRIMGLLSAVGDHLARAGVLSDARLMWRLSSAEVERALHDGARRSPAVGPDRWEPFVAGVALQYGSRHRGVAAAPGLGAGLVHVVDHAAPPPRAVLAARLPLPQLAPLLWRASAIVTAGGSPAAHLFEVARSLGIAAAAGVDLPDGAVAAVDGGVVAVLPPSAPIAEVA